MIKFDIKTSLLYNAWLLTMELYTLCTCNNNSLVSTMVVIDQWERMSKQLNDYFAKETGAESYEHTNINSHK